MTPGCGGGGGGAWQGHAETRAGPAPAPTQRTDRTPGLLGPTSARRVPARHQGRACAAGGPRSAEQDLERLGGGGDVWMPGASAAAWTTAGGRRSGFQSIVAKRLVNIFGFQQTPTRAEAHEQSRVRSQGAGLRRAQPHRGDGGQPHPGRGQALGCVRKGGGEPGWLSRQMGGRRWRLQGPWEAEGGEDTMRESPGRDRGGRGAAGTLGVLGGHRAPEDRW